MLQEYVVANTASTALSSTHNCSVLVKHARRVNRSRQPCVNCASATHVSPASTVFHGTSTAHQPLVSHCMSTVRQPSTHNASNRFVDVDEAMCYDRQKRETKSSSQYGTHHNINSKYNSRQLFVNHASTGTVRQPCVNRRASATHVRRERRWRWQGAIGGGTIGAIGGACDCNRRRRRRHRRRH